MHTKGNFQMHVWFFLNYTVFILWISSWANVCITLMSLDSKQNLHNIISAWITSVICDVSVIWRDQLWSFQVEINSYFD